MQGVQCQFCKWYLGSLGCMAYPERIPDKFLTGQEAHNKVEPDQEGNFVFEEETE